MMRFTSVIARSVGQDYGGAAGTYRLTAPEGRSMVQLDGAKSTGGAGCALVVLGAQAVAVWAPLWGTGV